MELPAGAVTGDNASASVLFDPLRAAVDGTARLRPVVSLVVGLGFDDAVWDHSTFSNSRDRRSSTEMSLRAFVRCDGAAQGESAFEHFSIDGTLIEAWASMRVPQAKEPPQDDSRSDPDEGQLQTEAALKSASTERSA
jgi:hypothetical protein